MEEDTFSLEEREQKKLEEKTNSVSSFARLIPSSQQMKSSLKRFFETEYEAEEDDTLDMNMPDRICPMQLNIVHFEADL